MIIKKTRRAKNSTATTKYKQCWGIVTSKDVVMETKDTEKDAIAFRDTAFNGYYKDCSVTQVKISI